MFWRQKQGLVRTERDVCQGCERWYAVGCPIAAGDLLAALERGMQVEVLFCPDFRPPLGGNRRAT